MKNFLGGGDTAKLHSIERMLSVTKEGNARCIAHSFRLMIALKSPTVSYVMELQKLAQSPRSLQHSSVVSNKIAF